MPDWIARHFPDGWSTSQLVEISVAVFLITSVGGLLAAAWAVVQIPVDYFADDKPPRAWQHRHALVRWPLLILKNLLGTVLVLLGIVLALPGVPGPGVLTILVGAILLDFPGKRACERWLLSRRGVLSSVNKLRARYGRAPLLVERPTLPPDCKPEA